MLISGFEVVTLFINLRLGMITGFPDLCSSSNVIFGVIGLVPVSGVVTVPPPPCMAVFGVA